MFQVQFIKPFDFFKKPSRNKTTFHKNKKSIKIILLLSKKRVKIKKRGKLTRLFFCRLVKFIIKILAFFLFNTRTICKSLKMASILLKNCSEVVYSKNGREKVGSEMAVVDVLTDSDVLIIDGKFKQIGKNLDAPEGVTVMDCSGKSGLKLLF